MAWLILERTEPASSEDWTQTVSDPKLPICHAANYTEVSLENACPESRGSMSISGSTAPRVSKELEVVPALPEVRTQQEESFLARKHQLSAMPCFFLPCPCGLHLVLFSPGEWGPALFFQPDSWCEGSLVSP